MIQTTESRLTLTPIAQNKAHGKWRTEAMRSHDAPRLIFVGKGQGRITIAGLTRGYGANNLIFIPAKTMYGMEVGPTVYCQMLTIPNAMATEWPDTPVHMRLRDVVAIKEFAVLLDALERELTSTQHGSDRAALYQLGLLSIFFERQLADREAEPKDKRHDTAAARLVAAYTDLVERHYADHLGVQNYAGMLGVTPTHLTRCCQQTAGRSALKILNDRILFEARLRLRDSTDPVRQVAEDLGFGSAAYFTRAFQARTGQTPTDFRKKGPLADA
ncbi:MAG: AraC family transcriptional regulator [Pseudomonadota bacterium]